MNKWNLSVIAAAALVAAAAMAAPPDASPSPSPSAKPSNKPAYVEPATKFAPATKEQADAARAQAEKLFADAKKIGPNMHLVESEHFLLYSEWDKSADKPISDLAEGLYTALCKQFDIPGKQSIWIGKCPIYTFYTAGHFHEFTAATAPPAESNRLEKAAGYCHSSNGVCYVVMDYTNSRSSFNTILVHESTHAFISRYLTNRRIPNWLNEGLAETMASTLVPDGFAAYRWTQATKEAVQNKASLASISKVLEEVRLVDYDYGVVQSVVRFLITRDRKAFIKFVTMLKEGESEEDALVQSYKLTRQDLIKAWIAAIGVR